MIYLENSDADYCKSRKKAKKNSQNSFYISFLFYYFTLSSFIFQKSLKSSFSYIRTVKFINFDFLSIVCRMTENKICSYFLEIIIMFTPFSVPSCYWFANFIILLPEFPKIKVKIRGQDRRALSDFTIFNLNYNWNLPVPPPEIINFVSIRNSHES
jgi:hypothetical protein